MRTENGTVIVVEDDPNIADLVDLYLRREGYRVLLAPDGEKGLEAFGQEDPWIVILDVGLPGARDGFEVCRQIRARSSVPVLFLTARDDEVDLRRREARHDGEVVALATREFDLLAFLANNAGLALSRQQLLDGVWGADWFGDERTVDVHVAQLRKKFGSEFPLATVWGVGYRFG